MRAPFMCCSMAARSMFPCPHTSLSSRKEMAETVREGPVGRGKPSTSRPRTAPALFARRSREKASPSSVVDTPDSGNPKHGDRTGKRRKGRGIRNVLIRVDEEKRLRQRSADRVVKNGMTSRPSRQKDKAHQVVSSSTDDFPTSGEPHESSQRTGTYRVRQGMGGCVFPCNNEGRQTEGATVAPADTDTREVARRMAWQVVRTGKRAVAVGARTADSRLKEVRCC